MNLRRLVRKLRTLGARDPTAKFKRQLPKLCLHYDVIAAALNGISYKSTVDDLAILGPASELYAGDGGLIQIQYDEIGVEITVDEDGVVSFDLSFAKEAQLSLGTVEPCQALELKAGDCAMVVANATSSQLLDQFLGTAYDRFNFSTGDLCSQYSMRGSHFVATHSADGTSLLRLEIAEAASSANGVVA